MNNRRKASEWTTLSLLTSCAGYLKAQKAECEVNSDAHIVARSDQMN
jgi:hypothetical protein